MREPHKVIHHGEILATPSAKRLPWASRRHTVGKVQSHFVDVLQLRRLYAAGSAEFRILATGLLMLFPLLAGLIRSFSSTTIAIGCGIILLRLNANLLVMICLG